MPEFRSYAREGQLGRSIQAPDKAKADYNRGKQFVGLLKEENVSTSERDQKFLNAWKEKLDKEKSWRQKVENAKRESIEKERKQRVANAQLKADFAEKEAKVNNARIEKLAELVPSIAKDLKTAADKRKEFDSEQALNTIHATGMTPKEIQEAVAKQYTLADWSSNKHAHLLRMKEAGMTFSQYNQLAKTDSIYGTARLKFSYQKASGNFPLFLSKMMGETLDDGTLVKDVFNSTSLNNNNRRPYGEELIKKFEESNGISNLTQSFRKELDPRGNLEAQYNRMRLKLSEKQEAQAHEAFVINETESVVGSIRANKFQQELELIATDQGPKAAHLHFKRMVPFIIKGISSGMLDEYESEVLNLQSYDQTGAKGIRPELNNTLQAAFDERRNAKIAHARVALNEHNIQNQQTILGIVESLQGKDPATQQQIIDTELRNSNHPMAVIKELNSYSAALNKSNENRSNQAEKFVAAEYARTGVPLSPQELKDKGLTGVQLTKWADIHTKWRTQGDKDLFDDFEDEMTSKYRTLVKSQPLADHPYQSRIVRSLMAAYSRSYNANRAHMPQAQADQVARKYVQDLWDKGTADPDQSKRTGPYKFTGTNPINGTFPNFDSSRGATQPAVNSISSAYDQHGSNFINIPNSLWTDNTLNAIELTTHSSQVPNYVIQHAQDAVAVTPEQDTWQQVLKAQMEASKMKVPAWLIKQTNGQTALIQQVSTINPNNQSSLISTLLHANKLGVTPGVSVARAQHAAGLLPASHTTVANIPNSARTDTTGFRTYNTDRYSAEELAMQDTIKFAEGTFGSDGYNTWAGFQKPKGYPTSFGIRTIADMHNWQTQFMNDGYTAMTGSAVMGAYQYKFAKRFATQAGLDPATALFNDENQDLMAQAALNNLGVTAQGLRNNGLTDEYIDKLAPTWASFPNLIGPDHYGRVGTNTSYYGQGGKTKQALKQFYLQRLNIYNKRGGGVPQKLWGII